jgi:predicted RecA/RadA family phage recombinase
VWIVLSTLAVLLSRMMGNLIGDLKAVDVIAPAGIINKGDLYRISEFTGFALSQVNAADTDRGFSLEIAMNRHWKVKVAAGINPAVGALLYWTAGAGFKDGFLDLTAAVTGAPMVKVVEAKNAAGYLGVTLVQNV